MPILTLSAARVLSVDDDKDACEMLSLLLESVQVDVTCVQSAAEAWPKINTEHFDLYLLDAWLPDIDGFELCRQIRASGSTTPILFYSGAAYDADKQRGIAAGASAYVTKPNVDRLINTMLNLITKTKAKAVAEPWTIIESRPAPKWLSAELITV